MPFTFFPSPLNDELVYSILARYRDLMGMKGSSRIIQEAFGQFRVNAALPQYLARLTEAIGHERSFVDELVDQHTSFNYSANFMVEADRSDLRAYFVDGLHFAKYNRIYGAVPHRRLSFCPECVAADQTAEEGSAWRRGHQLPGVFLCAAHGVGLRMSNVSPLTALLEACPSDPNDGEVLDGPLPPQIAYRLATATQWLLENRQPPVTLPEIRSAVQRAIRQRGHAHYGGRLHADFADFVLHESNGKDTSWSGYSESSMRKAVKLTHSDDQHSRSQPWIVLLVLAVLDVTPKVLFDDIRAARADGDERATKTRQPRHADRVSPKGAERDWYFKRLMLSTIEANPRASRSKIRQLASRAHDYLREHHSDWLDEKLPARQRLGRREQISTLDAKLAGRVADVAKQLKAGTERPRRVTALAIATELWGGRSPGPSWKRYPLTSSEILWHVEDEVQVRLRLIEWKARQNVACRQYSHAKSFKDMIRFRQPRPPDVLGKLHRYIDWIVGVANEALGTDAPEQQLEAIILSHSDIAGPACTHGGDQQA